MTPQHVLRAFGQALRELREQRGYSQSDLGFDRNHIHKMEQGEIDPKLTTGAELARKLGLSLTAFAAEIDRRRPLPAIEQSQDQMLPGGILLMVRTGRLDIAKTPQFQAELIEAIQRFQAQKLLLDFAAMQCDFSAQEQWEGSMALVDRLREADSFPIALAAVTNQSIDDFGVRVLSRQGCPSRLFKSREEALAWLRSVEL